MPPPPALRGVGPAQGAMEARCPGLPASVTRHHHAEVSAHAAQAVLAPRWGTRAACDSSSCTG